MSDIGELENYLEKFCSENPDIYNHKLIDEPDFRDRWQVVAAAHFNFQFDGKELSLAIGLDSSFPHSLPHVFLIPWDQLGFIPHVEPDGWICYAQKEGLVLNSETPQNILEDAHKRAILNLRTGLNGENLSDFVDEFESYWSKQKGIKNYISFLELNNKIREICIVDREDTLSLIFNKEDRSKTSRYTKNDIILETAIYIPLDRNDITPPRYDENWTIEIINQKIWSNLTLSKKDLLLKKLEQRRLRRNEKIFVSIPRTLEGKAIFGIEFQDISTGHPLLNGQAGKITPLNINRKDKSYITSRSHQTDLLSHKSVILIGCGSVGGYIATELARAGISDLTLVDHDKMEIENAYRHTLGKDHVGNNKAVALKKELERKIPQVHISTYNQRVEKAIEKDLKLDKFDLIISAMGEPSMELYLNKFIVERDIDAKTIFTWLEPYGIGGHALLFNNSENGCFKCLFTYKEIEDQQEYYNRASFAAPGQTFFKTIDGCGNAFTPYGSLSALNTASLATKMAINALKSKISGNPLYSWKGEKEEFINAGFELSNRYQQTTEELFENRYKYINHTCSICGGE
ncbi:ThiF family adenylyltransferase [Fodinibius sp. SL11]|uniref:ThiF family adenylyltransferase n=1 Tax=Fodinibius sp. SL11 TaxID=3425690 RepID=UPI003F882A8D